MVGAALGTIGRERKGPRAATETCSSHPSRVRRLPGGDRRRLEAHLAREVVGDELGINELGRLR
jgi:hypothetical protein